MADDQEPDPIPEDLLVHAAICDGLLDYTISLILGGKDWTRAFIERHLAAGAGREKKIKMLRLIFEKERPDVANGAPYLELWSDLRRLFDYRDVIAHSQPDHGDRFTEYVVVRPRTCGSR